MPNNSPGDCRFLMFSLSACSGGSFPPVFIGGTASCSARHVCGGCGVVGMCVSAGCGVGSFVDVEGVRQVSVVDVCGLVCMDAVCVLGYG